MVSHALSGGMGVPPVLETAMPSFAVCVFVLWLSGVVILGFRMVLAFLSLVIVAKGSRPISDGLANSLSSLANGRVAFRTSDLAGMPMTWGVIRPVLVLPADAEQWPVERVRAVVLHELAHVRRLDWLTETLTQLTCVLHWCNPLVWFIANRMQIEAEHACDDLVLLAGVAPTDYATHLLDVVRSIKSSNRRIPAAIAMAASASTVQPRLAAILEGGRNRRRATVRGVAVAGILAVAVLVPVAMVRPVARAAEISGGLGEAVSAPASGPKVTLSNGITVELVGVTSSPLGCDEDGWWSPSGAPVPDPEEGRERFHNSRWGFSDRYETRALCFRLTAEHAIDRGGTCGYIVDPTGEFKHFNAFNGRDPRQDDADLKPGIPSTGKVILAFPSKRDKFTYRFGIATGEWTTVASVKPALRPKPGTIHPASNGHVYGIGLSLGDLPEMGYWNTITGFQHQLFLPRGQKLGDVQRRVIAVDKDGRIVPDIIVGDNSIPVTDAYLHRVAELRLQTRPYQWAEFKDIAFNRAGPPPPAQIATPKPLPQYHHELAGGVSVDVVAMTKSRYDGGQWWLPDGTRLSGPVKEYQKMADVRATDSKGRRVAIHPRLFFLNIRTTGEPFPSIAVQMPGDLSTGGAIRTEWWRGGREWPKSIPLPKDHTLTDNLHGTYQPGTKSCSLRLAVAAGAWQTVGTVPMAAKQSDVQRLPETLENKYKGDVTLAAGAQPTMEYVDRQGVSHITKVLGADLTLSDDLAKRFVAVMADGSVRPLTAVTTLRDGDALISLTFDSHRTAHLYNPDLDLSQVKEFLLQTRPYHWTEFTDIALEPNA